MKNSFLARIYYKLRRFKYQWLSTNGNVHGKYNAQQPVCINGKGKVVFGNKVSFGVSSSPFFLNTYAYIEARNEKASIVFGNNISINNSFSVISEKEVIISNHVLIGLNCMIIDSNFHDLNPEQRNQSDSLPQSVLIEENVFIGNNVTILKGVVIGKNSVVASGSVVTKICPENVIIAGNPAKIISQINL